MQDPTRYRLSPHAGGALKVHREPVEGRHYVIGIDASGGGPDGDWAAAVVLDAESCGVAATWRDHIAPIPWGRKCALLGWWFNTALLSFETFPSAHGLSAAHAALQKGYQRLFRHRMFSRATRDSTDDLGWHTNSVSKPLLIDRLKLFLDDGCDCPSLDLIDELRAQRWDKPKSGVARIGAPKMVSDAHDDLTMALGVALMTRDTAWVAGQLRVEKPAPQTEAERFWAAREQMESKRTAWRQAMGGRRRA